VKLVKVIRKKFHSEDGVLGTLFVDGVEICSTLELPWRDNQDNISCIPNGFYDLKKITSPHFGTVYEIVDVKDRDDILIHSGNNVEDTLGCILVAEKWGTLHKRNAILNLSGPKAGLKSFMQAMEFDQTGKLCIGEKEVG
jgi:hypothetical protein